MLVRGALPRGLRLLGGAADAAAGQQLLARQYAAGIVDDDEKLGRPTTPWVSS